MARRLGDQAAAQFLLEHGLAIAKDIGDKRVILVALSCLGDLAERQGNYAVARVQLDEALKLARELGDKRVLIRADPLISVCPTAWRLRVKDAREPVRDLRQELLALVGTAFNEVPESICRSSSLVMRPPAHAVARSS